MSDDATKPEGVLRRDGMGRVEGSRPNGVEPKLIATRRLVASAAFVVARQRKTLARHAQKVPRAKRKSPYGDDNCFLRHILKFVTYN